jgi:threonine dehydrogenase-like Zn-dependent dehydrogenase
MLIPYTEPVKRIPHRSRANEWDRMGHAVVIGAGSAGLMAARVLWKHFDRVTILERDWRSVTPLLPKVAIVYGATVTRFAADWEYARITGIFVRSSEPGIPEDLLYADLVVDSTGRDSQTPRLLEGMGYPPPPEMAVGTRGWRRRYERLKRFPSGLLVLGDALCFDPENGLDAVARQAAVLERCLLRLDPSGTPRIEALTRNFRRSVARAVTHTVKSMAPPPRSAPVGRAA